MIGWLKLSPPVPSAGCSPEQPARAPRLGRSPASLAKQQRRAHAPLFLHQDIERAARRAEIHRLDGDTALRKCAANAHGGKALRSTCSQQYQLRLRSEQRLEIGLGEIVDPGGLPVCNHCVWRDDAAAMKHVILHPHFPCGVGPNEIQVGLSVERELHAVTIPAVEEVVIVIADLYLARAAEAASIRSVDLPGLGRIARFGSGEPIGNGWRAWLAAWAGHAALAAEAPASVASAASHVHAGEGQSPMVWLATPVHFVAGMSSVHLDARGLLQVELDVRQALAEEFNGLFAESGYRLEALPSAGFLLLSPTFATPPTVDPARCLHPA